MKQSAIHASISHLNRITRMRPSHIEVTRMVPRATSRRRKRPRDARHVLLQRRENQSVQIGRRNARLARYVFPKFITLAEHSRPSIYSQGRDPPKLVPREDRPGGGTCRFGSTILFIRFTGDMTRDALSSFYPLKLYDTGRRSSSGRVK